LGNQYAFTLTCHPNPMDPNNLYWKMWGAGKKVNTGWQGSCHKKAGGKDKCELEFMGFSIRQGSAIGTDKLSESGSCR
jgi:hypothetical protein